eukprot:TRINITY_DN92490_c0_g1_i1.p2 TRINITY_DN92490_c0_g1~~TRINITY_DN92490_c0_g1_i1.p2  ORF type:complete len:127 (-),score=6.12 TRINITY_DN92490_c0_g1_i1:255-635(-)
MSTVVVSPVASAAYWTHVTRTICRCRGVILDTSSAYGFMMPLIKSSNLCHSTSTFTFTSSDISNVSINTIVLMSNTLAVCHAILPMALMSACTSSSVLLSVCSVFPCVCAHLLVYLPQLNANPAMP